MSDEIDIEEHDVLDNPTIRSIFPDISVIKKEISQYDDDVTNIKEEPDLSIGITNITQSPLLNTDKLCSKNFCNGSPKKPFPLKGTLGLDNSYTIINNLPCAAVKGNKIILGSKPNTLHQTKTEKDEQINDKCEEHNNSIQLAIQIPRVVLQDLGLYIHNNSRYCKLCQTLFPSTLDHDDHKRKVHVVTTRNKPLRLKVTLEQKNKCNICGSCFSCRSNLSRHIKNVHKKNVSFKTKYRRKRTENRTNKSNITPKNSAPNNHVSGKNSFHGTLNKTNLAASNKIMRSQTQSKEDNAVNVCFHCKKSFPNQKILIEHIYQVLEPKFRLKGKTNENKFNTKEKMQNVHSEKLHIDLAIAVNHKKPASKTSRDKLIFESQDSDENGHQTLNDEENIESLRSKRKQDKGKRFKVNHTNKKNLNDSSSNENEDFDDSNENENQCLNEEGNIEILATTSKQKKHKSSISQIKSKLVENLNNKNQDIEISDENEYQGWNKEKNTKTLETMDKQKNEKCSSINQMKRKIVNKNFNNANQDTEDSDDHEFQSLTDEETTESLKTTSKRKKHKSSTINEMKRKLVNENLNDLNQDIMKAVCFKTSNKRKYESPGLAKGKSLKKIKINLNKVSKYKLNNEKPKKDTQHKPSKDSTITKREPVVFSAKLERKTQLSMNSENKIEQEKLQLYDTNLDKSKGKLVYECVYCSYIVPTTKAYHMHVVEKHKVDKILGANRVIFDEQCQFCPSKSQNDKSRNNHIHRYHSELLHKNFSNESEQRAQKNTKSKMPDIFKTFESFVLEAIIYKCIKCDIHFLSSSIAKDHDNHMELLVNWKCTICQRIFKKNDKHLHLKQHTASSKTLNVCQYNETELSYIIYNCTKCTIHFTEERYLEHYSSCGNETTDSVYCKVCDILVDKCGYTSHEAYHKMGLDTGDFNVIVADIITNPINEKTEVAKKRKRLCDRLISLTFCPTCNCYLNDIGLSRKIHTESRCSNLTKYACNLCGLVLTNKSLQSHKEHHKKNKELNLHHFKFFDLKGNQINPQMPVYPRCNICEVTFVRRMTLTFHMCSEIEYLMCDICNIKLSKSAYKLHMNFHDYPLTSNCASQAPELNEKKRKPNNSNINTTTPSLKAASESTSSNAIIVDNKGEDTQNPTRNILYSCQPCNMVVNTYDEVIEHCQNHYSPLPVITSSLNLMFCSKCSLLIEIDLYNMHQNLHSQYNHIKLVTFDPTYFTAENSVWIQHIFSSVCPSLQNKILSESIYRYECRFKMDIAQKGPSYLTVYQCKRCGNFIDPVCLVAHIKCPCIKNIRKFPCSICGLPFMAQVFRSKHEKIHKRYDNARLKTYNIVLINCEAHTSYNISMVNAMKQYVLYQCRTCDGIVEKFQRNDHQCNLANLQKCPECKLLVYKDSYSSHISKHADLAILYNAKTIKVVLFGNKDDDLNKEKTLSPSFIGVVHDYKLFKCANCEVCVNNQISISKHNCTFNDSKWKCPKCSFYICARSLKQHTKMHDVGPEFKNENIKIIVFGSKHSEVNSDEKVEQHLNLSIQDCSTERAQKSNVDYKSTDSINLEGESISLFKCNCGLHYVDKLNAEDHVKRCPKIKVIRQKCSKCTLVFNPKELFNHVIAHHGDTNKTFKYKITEISAENEVALYLDI